LIFNWENEIKKFTPDLTYHIHHGGDRSRIKEEITRHNVVITTYGTLRSDIKMLMEVPFDYTVLDESQAIKIRQARSPKQPASCAPNIGCA
jgi:non-specific serine/threonine protein kinase